jgi:hypothetical protein
LPPLQQSPFQGGGNWSGGSSNPYASATQPSFGTSVQRTTDNRRGLPWDRAGAGAEEFFETISNVLGEPRASFGEMKRYGSFARPLLYYMINGFAGGLATAIYNGLWTFFDPLDKYPDAAQQTIAITIAIYCMVGTLVGISLGPWISAAIFHMAAKMVGATQPFETTFRVICYSGGSIAVFQLVPVLGGCVAFVYALVLHVVGLSAAHGISTGKSTAAFVLGMMMHFGLCFVLFCASCLGFSISFPGLNP